MNRVFKNKSILFILALLISCCLTGCSSGKKSVDMNDYVTINYSGYDGNAKATAYIDYDAMYYDTIAENSDSLLIYTEKYDKLTEAVYLESYTVGENLSNGDTITVELVVDKEKASDAGIKVKTSTITYAVSDLEPIQYLDAFAYLDISYSGYAPYGTASYTTNFPEDMYSKYSYISYDISPCTGLSNGDTITVTATISDSAKLAYGIDLMETSKEYTVEGLDTYITDISQIDEETLNSLIAEAMDQLAAEYASFGSTSFAISLGYFDGYSKTFTYDEPQVYCAYYLTENDMESNYYYELHGHSVLRIIFETHYNISDSRGLNEDGVFYSTVCYVDLIKELDGDIVNTSNISVSKNSNLCYTTFDSIYMNYITTYKGAYEIAELDSDFTPK